MGDFSGLSLHLIGTRLQLLVGGGTTYGRLQTCRAKKKMKIPLSLIPWVDRQSNIISVDVHCWFAAHLKPVEMCRKLGKSTHNTLLPNIFHSNYNSGMKKRETKNKRRGSGYSQSTLDNVEKDTQPVTWRQMASKPQNNQPSAVICRGSCQEPPRGSACVKQTFAQRPFSCFSLFIFFIFFLYFVLVIYAVGSSPTFTPGILLQILKASAFPLENQGSTSAMKDDLKFCDAEDCTSGYGFSCLLHFGKKKKGLKGLNKE